MIGMCQVYAATHKVEMNNLTKHDVEHHWRHTVMRWGAWTSACDDFEVAHKWALKQFVRVVPHGQYFQAHLARRHLGQFSFAAAQPDDPAQRLRHCHCAQCKAVPGHHKIHVHVVMPGLTEEDDEGLLHVKPRAEARAGKRTLKDYEVATQGEDFQVALQRLMGDVQGVSMEDALMPDTVFRATRMKLLWHNAEGKVEHTDTFHSAEHYYGAPWHDALMGKHTAVTRGPARCSPGPTQVRCCPHGSEFVVSRKVSRI